MQSVQNSSSISASLVAARPGRRVHVVAVRASRSSSAASSDMTPTRRETLLATTAFLAASATSAAAPLPSQAKGAFEVLKDAQDGYQFVFPFGWQEVSVSGQDTVYKDVIEPLESVSVSYIPTDKQSILEYGDVKEVSYTLVRKVLTTVNQEVKLLAAEERKDESGRLYYDFEYTASTPRYTRHALASVTIGNGKFYTLETGANERRWGKMKDKIARVQKSFTVSDRQDY